VSFAALAVVFATLVAGGPALAKKPPKLKEPVTEEPGPNVKVYFVADQVTYNGKTGVAVATGRVVIDYGPYKLTASRVEYNTKTGTFKANGSVVLREPNGNVLMARSATMMNKFKEGFAHHLKALLTNDTTITAEYARMYENDITIYRKASYTACKNCTRDGGDPLWEIVSKEAKHDGRKKTIYYDDMFFRIGGVPVFYLPYLAYPDPTVKRRTGFIWPSFKYGDAYGFGVAAPFFWALAPDYDLTLSPFITTGQGILGDVEWRHKLEKGFYNIHAYGIYELDPDRTEEPDQWRGAVTTRGRFRTGNGWRLGWNGVLASDKTFLGEYDISNRGIAQNRLHATQVDGRNYVSAELLDYRTLRNGLRQEDLPQALPYLRSSHILKEQIFGGELGVDTESYVLRREDPVTGTRLGTQQTRTVSTLSWKKQVITSNGIVFMPFTKVRGELTSAENVPGAASSSTGEAEILPSAGIDLRWPLIANGARGSSVITPVAQVIAATDAPATDGYGNENALTLNFDPSNLFLDDRHSGSDRYGGGGRANVGILYNYIADNGWSVRAAAGQSIKLAGENGYLPGSGLDGPQSDLVGSLAVQPWDHLNLTYTVRAEEDLSRINAQEAWASLTFDRISASLAYADIAAAEEYGRPDHEQQIWGDARLRLGGGWSMFGGLRYDLEYDDFVQKSIGLAFNCDCMNAELRYAEKLTADTANPIERSIFLSVSFRTLGAASAGFSF
jgi:LPS-assembly protein